MPNASLVSAMSRQMSEAMRAVLSEAIANGWGKQETARRLREVIGLTPRQVQTLRKFEAARRASGRSSPGMVARAVDQFAAKMRRQRAAVIARTELTKAATAGQIRAWKQAQRQGRLGANARKVWVTIADDRRCPICRPLHNRRHRLDIDFQVKSIGSIPGPPAHPNCRCYLDIVSAVRVRARRAA